MDQSNLYITNISKRITYATTNCDAWIKLGEATYGKNVLDT